MALRKIRVLGDPVLRSRSEEIRNIDSGIENLSKDMADSINSGYQPGVGLAAPQIGVQKRMIAVKCGDSIEFYINPEIEVLDSAKETLEEGCLSIPDINAAVNRYSKIKVRALSLEGKKIELLAEGLKARIFQHEVDHLDGVLFVDRVDKKTKREIIMQYNQSNDSRKAKK